MEEQIYTNIARVLNGEATAAEQRELEAWIASDPANRQAFEEMKLVWQDADLLLKEPSFDHEAAWQRVSSVVGQHKQTKIISMPGWRKYLMAAAAILVAGFIVWNTFTDKTFEVKALAGNEEVILPDSSHVILRKGSTLVYPVKFDSRERHVTLNGEAFFDVARNEKHPFTIDAGTATVKVLGTSFNVSDQDSSVSVVVATGKVEVRSNEHKQIAVVLTPGEKATIIKDRVAKEILSSDNFLYWKTGELVFNNKSLKEVVTEISEYGAIDVRLEASEKHRNQIINISFHNQSPEDMLTELSMITKSKWTRKGNSYIISTGK